MHGDGLDRAAGDRFHAVRGTAVGHHRHKAEAAAGIAGCIPDQPAEFRAGDVLADRDGNRHAAGRIIRAQPQRQGGAGGERRIDGQDADALGLALRIAAGKEAALQRQRAVVGYHLGCYNRIIQNFNYGERYTPELQERILNDVSASYCQGLTLLGGEPFLNTQILIPLCQAFRERFGDSKDIWAWTGYTWEEMLQETEDKLTLLHLVDVLVDGRFELAKKDLTLRFRGSFNQRIIRVPESLATGEIILWCPPGKETTDG